MRQFDGRPPRGAVPATPSLDQAQVAAVTGKAAIQLTLAGPGSGKTTTLAARFAHLVENGTEPARILAVTFTKKAADEMRVRIAQVLGRDPDQGLRVMTFHAFAYRHLRHSPQVAGLPPSFQLWDNVVRRNVFHSRQMWWNEEIDIFDIIDGMKERLVDAAAFARLAQTPSAPPYYAKAVPFFAEYEAALREAGAIDFADMAPLLEQAMRRHPAFRQMVVEAFDHLLVDEYQDVNPGQLALIDHFVAAGTHLWAVGDDDQTLFAFRASNIRHVLDFDQRHRNAAIHVLDRNYRSSPEIASVAKTLIRNNHERADKDYLAVLPEQENVVLRGYRTAEIEARQVAAAIATLLDDGHPPREIAALYRAGTVGLPLQAALKDLNIPFEVRGSGDLWQNNAAKLVIGALHYLRDGATPAAMSRLGNGRRAETIVGRLDEVRPPDRRDFKTACNHVRGIVGAALPGKAADRERVEWASLVEAVVGLASTSGNLDELERRIALQSAALRTPPEHAVVLSTIHSAKGLEWDAVFLLGLEDGVLPNANADDIEEERRIAYVGMTRARRLLGLTYCSERYGSQMTPSPFLREIRTCEAVTWSGPNARAADRRLPLITAEDVPAKPSRARGFLKWAGLAD